MRYGLTARWPAAIGVSIAQESPVTKNVIEPGWGEPDTKFMLDNSKKMPV